MVVESLITGACSIATALLASRVHRRGSWESVAVQLALADQLAEHAKDDAEAALAEEVRRDAYSRTKGILHPDRRWARVMTSPSGIALTMAVIMDVTSIADWSRETGAGAADTAWRLMLSLGISTASIVIVNALDSLVGSYIRKRCSATTG